MFLLFMHILKIHRNKVIMKEYLKNLKYEKTYSYIELAAYPKWKAGILSHPKNSTKSKQTNKKRSKLVY